MSSPEGQESQPNFSGQGKSKAQPGSAAGQDAGGAGGSQSPQEVTRQLGSDGDAETGSVKVVSPTFPLDQCPTITFEVEPNKDEIASSPLSYGQWEHIFNQKKLFAKLCVVTKSTCKKDENTIRFTKDRQHDDPKWSHTILGKLKHFSSQICNARCQISDHLLTFFEEKWKEETFIRDGLVTCLLQRCNPTSTFVIFSEDADVLKEAENTAKSSLERLEVEVKLSVIKVHLQYFDASCLEYFAQSRNFSNVSMCYEKKDEETWEVRLSGPPSECSEAAKKISPVLTTLTMEQVKCHPETELWVSQEKTLGNMMQEECPGILLVMTEGRAFLIGQKEDVQKGQQWIQDTVCTKEYHLHRRIIKLVEESVQSEGVGAYPLLVSCDAQRQQLKLTGPNKIFPLFLQRKILFQWKKPNAELQAKIQAALKGVSFRQMQDGIGIEGPIFEVEDAYQMIVDARPKAQSGASEETAIQPRVVSRATLMKLLQIPDVKIAVDTHLELPKRETEGIQWRFDQKKGELVVTCKDKQKRAEIVNEIWGLFGEREIRMDKSDDSMKRLEKNWPALEKELNDYCNCSIVSLDTKEKLVHLACLNDRLGTAFQNLTYLLNIHLKDNTAEEIGLTKVQDTHLIRKHGETVEEISQKAENSEGTMQIKPAADGVNFKSEVTGTPSVDSTAVKSLQQWQEKESVKEVEVPDASLAFLTSSDEGVKFLKAVEDKYNCCVTCPQVSLVDQGNPSGFAEVTLPGGTNVSLQQGSLKLEGVNVVVLPIPVKIRESSSPAPLPEGCPEFLKDQRSDYVDGCKKLRNSDKRVLLLPKPMKPTSTKVALFKVPWEWNDGKNGEKDHMRLSVKDLLELVQEKKFRSVAIDVPFHLPEKVAEKQILYELSNKGTPYFGIKSVKLFTKRERDQTELLTESFKPCRLTASMHAEGDASAARCGQAKTSPMTRGKIVISGSDKEKVAQAAHMVTRFQPPEKPTNSLSQGQESQPNFSGQRKSKAQPGSAAGQDAGGPGDSQSPQEVTRRLGSDGETDDMFHAEESGRDVSKEFPSLVENMTADPDKSIEMEVASMMRKLADCRLSFHAGKLHLRCPPQKQMLALAICQCFETMVADISKSPSRHGELARSREKSQKSDEKSRVPSEFDEIVIRAAKHLSPSIFKDVKYVAKGNGKVTLSSLPKEKHDFISTLQRHDIEIADEEMEKAKTVRDAFQTKDAYVEFILEKQVITVFTMNYEVLQNMVHKMKIDLGQIKTSSRKGRHITPQTGNSDMGVEGASPASASHRTRETTAEATGKDNSITLPGGLEVIPYKTDITKLKVDAIVNAANEHLSHGAGVARAIADAAGPELKQECQDYIDLNGPIPVSGVCATGAGHLPCSRVFHAVGPRWDSRNPELCRQQLYNTVLNCCGEADKWELKEIAMPAISSSIFGMPHDQCTEMYCKALLNYDQQPNKKLKTVHFVDIKDDMPRALLKALRKEIGQGQQRTRPPEADVDLSQGCVICTEKDFDQPVKLNDCNHVFCKGCIEQWFQTKPTCPSCNKQYGIITGTMPWGTMNFHHDRYTKLAGFENCGCIVIDYYVPDGVQKEEHPNPRQPYKGARRTAYLPDNAEGNKVLRLLQEAWNRKLTFTIGRSTTTGQENVVTWNDIHHKTSTVPRHPFGYPDPDYLTRVQEELAARGVTEESIRLAQSGNPQDFSQFYTPLRPPRPTNAPHFV